LPFAVIFNLTYRKFHCLKNSVFSFLSPLQSERGNIAFPSSLQAGRSNIPSLRANAKQSSVPVVIPAQRVSIAKQYPKIKLSFTYFGQPTCGLDSRLSAENDNLKKHRRNIMKTDKNAPNISIAVRRYL
jgi:hypothetical protein